jgi:peptide deformylase
MIKEVIVVGDERLSKVSEKVENINDIRGLIEDLKDTINVPEKMGLGLAAPQLGENVSVFVMRTTLDSFITQMADKPLKVIINPEIKKAANKFSTYREACLSVPGKVAVTKRYKEIKVKYMNEEGNYVTETFKGTEAIVFQHEFAHLLGMTILDEAIEIADVPEETEIKQAPLEDANTGFEDIEEATEETEEA